MKKTMIYALMAVLLVSLAVSVSAAPSAAEMEQYPVPALLSCSCDKMEIFTTEEVDELEEAARENFLEAEDRLSQAVTGEMTGRDFFYVDLCEECQESDANFRVESFDTLMIKQYVDHQWISLEYTANSDGTVTVSGLVDGPVVFVVGRLVDVPVEPAEPTEPAEATPDLESAEAGEEDLTPEVVEASCEQFMVYTTETVELLHNEEQKLLEKAKEALAEAAPEGMAARYFFYVTVCEICNESTVELELEEYQELVIMQFVDEAWVELEYTVSASGTISVENVVDGPMTVFVKVTE